MAEKQRVLVVADWFDPAYRAGGPVRSLINLVGHLQDQCEFSIICGSRDYGSTTNLSGVETDCWTDWHGQARVYYMSPENQRRRVIFDLLDETPADVLYVQGIFSRIFSILPVIWWHQAKREKLIVAPRGMLHASALGIKPWKKRLFLFSARLMGWYNHVLWHSTNPEETAQIKAVMGEDAAMAEAPNFPQYITRVENDRTYGDTLRVLCISRISDEKNPLLLLKALRQLDFPVELTIAGDYLDESYFRKFMEALNTLPANVKATYLGAVEPGKLAGLYRLNHLFVLPTRGENFGHAIAEALMYGLPAIIGENTPWAGLGESRAGRRLPLDEGLFASAITELHQLPAKEKNAMSFAAMQYVNQKLKASEIRDAYVSMFYTENEEEEQES